MYPVDGPGEVITVTLASPYLPGRLVSDRAKRGKYLARWYGRLPSLASPKGGTMCIFFYVFTPFFLPFAKIQPMCAPICHHLSVPRHLFLISSSQHSAPYRHFIISNAGTSDGARLFSYGFPYENSLAPSLAPTLELMKCP